MHSHSDLQQFGLIVKFDEHWSLHCKDLTLYFSIQKEQTKQQIPRYFPGILEYDKLCKSMKIKDYIKYIVHHNSCWKAQLQ